MQCTETPNEMDTPVEDSKERIVIISRTRILKNVLIISFTFFLLFASFLSLQSLQSSLHRDEGMGTLALSLLYGSMAATSLFLPKLMIQKVGHKWCIILAMVGYLVWMAANGYAGK